MALFRKPPPPETSSRRRPQLPDSKAVERPGQAFSYYSRRSAVDGRTERRQPQSDETQPPGRSAAGPGQLRLTPRHRLGLNLGIVLVVIAGLYFSSLSTQPHIILHQDAATANFLQDPQVYQQDVHETLAASFLSYDKLTVDRAAIRLNLLKNYPEIQNVTVDLPILGHQPQVSITPYKPSFILTTTSSTAFLLDTTGRALASTASITNIEKLGLPTLQDRSGVSVKLGNRALPSSTVSFAQTVVSALKQAQVRPSSLVLPPAAYELDVYIAETPYFVKFNLQNDPLEQAGTYLATRKRLKSDKVAPAQYIDVRVPQRAYYK